MWIVISAGALIERHGVVDARLTIKIQNVICVHLRPSAAKLSASICVHLRPHYLRPSAATRDMPAELLEFEEPIGVLRREIEALSELPETEQRRADIARLENRITQIRGEIYRNLTPWQRVLVARHPSRPATLDYVDKLCTDFIEIRGDRRFADDHAIIAGLARYRGDEILVVGHQKGSDTKQKIFRNFGYARPEGYRKALRAMQMAQKFRRPIVCFVDTPAAYPGIESEERGVAEAIALNLREMVMLPVPVIIVVHGEGGSGGALGIAVGDRILMHEFAVYSVIPPEGCAAILWRDSSRKVEAADALKLTAPDLLRLGIIDEIVPEPVGGAHTDPTQAAAMLDSALDRALGTAKGAGVEIRLEQRYQKFRRMGSVGIVEA